MLPKVPGPPTPVHLSASLRTKMLLGFNSLWWCISAVLTLLIVLLACDISTILPRSLAGLHQHRCIFISVRWKDG